MALPDQVDLYLGDSGGVNLATVGTHSQSIARAVHDDNISTPLIATIFWQAFMNSSAFGGLVSEEIMERGEKMIVRHGVGTWPRQDLLIFDPDFSGPYPYIVGSIRTYLQNTTGSQVLFDGWRTFIQRYSFAIQSSSPFGSIILDQGGYAAVEALDTQPFGLIIDRMPPIEFTAMPPLPPTALSPSPALAADPVCSSPQKVTVGVCAKSAKSGMTREGVTTANHAFKTTSTVIINGNPYSVKPADQDLVTDSCFIEVKNALQIGNRGPLTPLTGVVPIGAQMSYESIGRGRRYVKIGSCDPSIPWVNDPLNQQKVYTACDTIPGDSGTALIDDSSGHVIGFAIWKIADPNYQCSAWIWANSVFEAHSLS